MEAQPLTAAAVAISMISLALAGGGSGDAERGIAAILVWLALLALLLSRRVGFAGLGGEAIPFVAAFGALCLWGALSAGWGFDDAAAVSEVTRNALYLGIVLIVLLLARRGSASSWLTGLAAGGVGVALIALASASFSFGGFDYSQEIPLAVERLTYPIGYWNALGYLMAMTLPSLMLVATRLRTPQAALATAAFVPVLLTLFLTSSRGAVLAGLLAAGVALAGSEERDRHLQVWIAVAIPAALAIAYGAIFRSDLTATADLNLAAASTMPLALILGGAAGLLHLRLVSSSSRPASVVPGVPRRALILVGVVFLGLAVTLGPDRLLGDFRSAGELADGETSSGVLSSSGRTSFWEVGLEAFSDEPVRGKGAGGFPGIWAEGSDARVPVQNAHSEPIELMAELGIVGLATLLVAAGALIVAARRRTRPSGPGAVGLASVPVAILAAAAVSVTLDWTWELAAASLPALVAAGLLTGEALRPPWDLRGESVIANPEIPGYLRVDGPRVPRVAISLGTGAFAVAAIWVGVVTAGGAIQLERSGDQLAGGYFREAAASARSAAEIQPWSAAPRLRLAEIEQAAGNLEAARRRAEEAASLAPFDARPWFLLAQIRLALGDRDASNAYLFRAATLGATGER